MCFVFRSSGSLVVVLQKEILKEKNVVLKNLPVLLVRKSQRVVQMTFSVLEWYPHAEGQQRIALPPVQCASIIHGHC